jgi:hypothetical protein
MPISSNVFVYELTTRSNTMLRASVSAVSLAILDDYPDLPDRHVWIVATTMERALTYNRLSWVIKAQQLGPMIPAVDREALVFFDPRRDETYRVAVEALEG